MILTTELEVCYYWLTLSREHIFNWYFYQKKTKKYKSTQFQVGLKPGLFRYLVWCTRKITKYLKRSNKQVFKKSKWFGKTPKNSIKMVPMKLPKRKKKYWTIKKCENKRKKERKRNRKWTNQNHCWFRQTRHRSRCRKVQAVDSRLYWISSVLSDPEACITLILIEVRCVTRLLWHHRYGICIYVWPDINKVLYQTNVLVSFSSGDFDVLNKSGTEIFLQ